MKRKYRVVKKRNFFLVQSRVFFRWVTIGKYEEEIKANIIKNGMALQ
jgi:hypothetical protein